MKSFASDNYSGVAPEIMQAILAANQDHQPAYGHDPYTQAAEVLLQETFGEEIKTYFAYNGTAANSVAIKALLRSHHAILCSDIAHIATQEVGASTNLTACPTLLIPHQNGKITASAIGKAYEQACYWGHHGNLPKLVSIAQSTELGTVYTLDELHAIREVCKKHQLIFHMDGCRLANAAVALECSLAATTREVGVDVLSFGGTKNGLMFGEVIVFFHPELATEFAYVHKQNLQLYSKMRFLSAQFIPYLKNQLWQRYAQHANQMSQALAQRLSQLKGVRFAYPVQTNQIFAHLPEPIVQAIPAIYPFHLWDKSQNLARLVTSFDTTEQDVDHFIDLARRAIS